MAEAITVVTQAELVDADPTPGMHRQRAIDVPGLGRAGRHPAGHRVGLAPSRRPRDQPVHGSGVMRLEFGPGGRDAVQAVAGDFVHVPSHLVHREVNPGDPTSTAVIVRAGGAGPSTVNVDGPHS